MKINLYNLRARVYPLLLSLIPILIIGIVYSISFKNYYQTLSSFGIMTFLYFIFSQLGRDKGKLIEKEMWKKWNGAPTTQLFRYANEYLDKITKKKYHKILKDKTKTGNKISIDYEKRNPQKADEIYQSWTKYLISKTRDIKTYNLLFQENTNYGFRRNLYGLKKFSILILIILIFIVLGYSYFMFGIENFLSQEVLISMIIISLFLIFWIFIVKQKWIKITAFAYAERLLETINTL